MRIRPIDIEVPDDEPFANDRLERRDQVEAIAAVLAEIEGPFVLAVDAPWGEGKTTFLRMSQVHLRNTGFLLVGFNAWETDFCDDPFIALTTELTQALEQEIKSGSEETISDQLRDRIGRSIAKIREQSVSLAAKRLGIIGIRLLTQNTIGIDLSSLFESPSGKNKDFANSWLESYGEQKQLMTEFTDTLSALGKEAKVITGLPLVIFIDELDRCRPTYAIELLETVKHLFSVDNIIFVLGLNREELAHSVRAVYGEQFNAEKYLSRLIDIDMNLPRPDLSKFIDSTIESSEIRRSLRHNQTRNVHSDFDDTQSMIRELLGSSELSIRDMAQSIHHLGLVLASLPPRYYPLLQITVILLCLRSVDRALYSRFTRGEASDADVVHSLFDRPGLSSLTNTRKGAYIEAHIIRAYREMISQYHDGSTVQNTPLFAEYQDILKLSPLSPSENSEHAEKVVDRVDGISTPDGKVYTHVVISRIEMFAKSIAE